MAYRNIVVQNPAKITVKNQQLLISSDQIYTIPLEDINTLLIENQQSTITSAALTACTQNNITVFVCDNKHLPCGVLLPYCQHSRQYGVLKKQLSITLPQKKQLWQQIVKAKIINQSKCLALCQKQNQADYLISRANAVKSGDSDNMEAIAAAYYFEALFGKGFTRQNDIAINAALNYGYAIIRGTLARLLAAYGFLPSVGIHHCNELNQFNLADDLIEPFRPAIDLFVVQNIYPTADFTTQTKHCIYNILNNDILMDNKHYSIAYAIELLVQSFARYVINANQQLTVPQLIKLQQHRYE